MYREIQEHYGCNFEHFGDTWRKAKLKLFGHILRSSKADPLLQVTFASDALHPRLVYIRRPGRPKADWASESYKDAFLLINGQGALSIRTTLNTYGKSKQKHIAESSDHLRLAKATASQGNPCGISSSGCTVLSTVRIPF